MLCLCDSELHSNDTNKSDRTLFSLSHTSFLLYTCPSLFYLTIHSIQIHSSSFLILIHKHKPYLDFPTHMYTDIKMKYIRFLSTYYGQYENGTSIQIRFSIVPFLHIYKIRTKKKKKKTTILTFKLSLVNCVSFSKEKHIFTVYETKMLFSSS